MVKIKPSARVPHSKPILKSKRKVPIQSISDGESSTLEGDEAGVDDEGMQRLMDALGDDGLDEYSGAHIAIDDEGEEEEEENPHEDSEDESEDEADEDSNEDEEMDGDGSAGGKPSNFSSFHKTALGEVEDDEDDDSVSDEEEDAADALRDQNNAVAMKRLRQLIELDSTLPWTEHLVVTYPQSLDSVNPDDDLNREVAFYKQALHCAEESKKLAAKHSLPFTRPADFFAEMVKSDIHMERIRTKLLDEAASIKKIEAAKRQRDLKKFGKQVQVEKLKERAQSKKEMIDKVKSLKRKRSGGADAGDDDFNIELDDALDDERPVKRGMARGRGRGRGRGGPGMPREVRDKKYHWGGQGGRNAKSNDKESTNNFDFDRRGGRGRSTRGGRGGKVARGGGRGPPKVAKRLGKSRRQKA